MSLSPPLVVTGLPYSGSAVVAEALHGAGLPLGGPFLAPSQRDLVGAFVDRGIHDWHVRWAAPPFAAGFPSPGDGAIAALEELETLLEQRFANVDCWGFRSPLALAASDLWRRRFPDARWLIVVRAPSVQVASFANRSPEDSNGGPAARPARAVHGLRLWSSGAERALALAREIPDRVLVVDAAHLAGNGDAIAGWLRASCGFELAPTSIPRAFRPFLLRREAPRWIRWLARLQPGVGATWNALRRLAVPAAPQISRPGPRTCVVAAVRYTPSESFIQEQLRRLPGEVHFLHRRDGLWRDRDCKPLLGFFRRLRIAVARELGLEVDTAQSRSVARYLRRHRIDCVLANFGAVAVDMSPACRVAGVPLVAHFHGADAHRERPTPGSATFYAPVFAQAAAIVAVSRPMIERLVELGAPREKIRLNPCGVDLDDFSLGDPAAAPPRFVAAGRFVGKKGPHLTLLAFARALAAAPRARLVMLGDGILRETCVRLAAALGITDRVDFPGAYAHAELSAHLRRARAFLQHSLQQSDGDSEGSPVAVIEAAASGLPVVSTRHAGIPFAVLDGVTGLLCDEGDVDAMASQIAALANDPDRAAELGRRGRQLVARRFALEMRISRLAEIVAAVADRRPSPVVDDVAEPTETLGQQTATLAKGRARSLEE